MKRILPLLLCFGLVFLTGCDRQKMAWLILNLGFNVRFESMGAFSEPQNSIVQGSLLEQAADSMTTLRGITSDKARAALEFEQGIALVERIDELTDLYGTPKSPEDAHASVLAEARVAALEMGAHLHPDLFQARFEEARKTLTAFPEEMERRALNRFVSSFLSSEQLDPELPYVARLHLATYPEAESNATLMLTAIGRLATAESVREAIRVNEAALAFCQDPVQRKRLSAQLQKIYADFPTTVGVPMNFAGPDLKGHRLELKNYKGNPLLVVFWATWCPGCVEEADVVQRVADQFLAEGLRVVAVNMDSNRSDLQSFIDSHGLTWDQIFTDNPQSSGWDNPIANYYKIESIPYVFLLDQQGKIAAAGLRSEADMVAAIDRVLND